MRQNNNKRMRGRSSNNNSGRRAPNPLTRSFESNGPDVKVRGTAQHIAEKYTQLARDAHTSGDRVAAESYLQHAEHYFRIISAAHLAQQARDNGTEERDDGEDEEFDTVLDRFTFRAPQSAPTQNGNGAQPFPADRAGGDFPLDAENVEAQQPDGLGEQPRERSLHNRQQGERLPQQAERNGERNGDRFQQQDRRNGERRNEQNPNPRFDRNRDRGRGQSNTLNERAERSFRPRNEGEGEGERFPHERPTPDRFNGERAGFKPRNRVSEPAEMGEQPILPAFLTAPVRAIPIEVVTPAPEAFSEGEGGEGRSQFRARRRRKPVAQEGQEGGLETASLSLDVVSGKNL